ncbi:MAG: TRAP transporter substrate-binding protein [Acidiphilium sp.]
MAPSLTRKQFLVGAGAASAVFGILPARAARAIQIKCGVDMPPTHPITINAVAAAKKVNEATKGAVNIQVFPNNQLGDDTHMLSEVRSGAIQMMMIGDSDLAVLVPEASITNIGFAFKSSDAAYRAVDGKLGDMVRSKIIAAGLYPLPLAWDEGLRQMTSGTRPIRSPADLHGFKMRVPPSPIMLSLFKSLGASPVSINISELYTSMQTHVADGEENSLAVIELERLYEVQKYCSITNHMWIGYWNVLNGAFWKTVPKDHQKIIIDAFDAAGRVERQQTQALNASLASKLKKQGMTFLTPDQKAFREATAQGGFYKEWKAKFGPKLWSTLETYSGPLG